MTQVMSYGVRPSIGRRINFRMVTIIAVMGLLVGYPVYTFVKAQVNGGIEWTGKGAALVDLKALGNFPFNDENGRVADVPKRFRDLDGKQVTLEGFMYCGSSAADRVPDCQFVYSISKCCFGGPPLVQERVFGVAPRGGAMYNYGTQQMIRLTGRMHVQVTKDPGGKISSIYKLDVTDEQPVS